MYGHDTHDIRIFIQSIGFPEIDVLPDQSVDVAQKLEQTGKISLCKMIRMAFQEGQVGTALGAGRECCTVVLISGLFQNACHQSGDRRIPDTVSPGPVKGEKIPAFFGEFIGIRFLSVSDRFPRSTEERIIEKSVGLHKPDPGDLILGKSAEKPSEHTI